MCYANMRKRERTYMGCKCIIGGIRKKLVMMVALREGNWVLIKTQGREGNYFSLLNLM